MLPFIDILSYCISVFILIVIPGPTMLYLTSRTLQQGRMAGIVSLLGVNLADLVFIFIVIFGVSTVLFSTPFLFTTIKIGGAAYLLYLAYDAIRTKPVQQSAPSENLTRKSYVKLFSIGFLTNIVNPKVILFFSSIFSQFINPAYGEVWKQSALLGILFILISFLTNSLFIFGASKLGTGKREINKWQRVQNWVLASVLTFIAVKVVLQT